MQVAQDHVQMDFENVSTNGDYTISPGNMYHCLTILTVKMFSRVQTVFHVFNLCPLPLVLLLGTTEKSLVPSLLQGNSLSLPSQPVLPEKPVSLHCSTPVL